MDIGNDDHRSLGYKLSWRQFVKIVFGWEPEKSISSETAWLNGMRGLAAFLVMMGHYSLAFLTFVSEAPFGSVIVDDFAFYGPWYWYKGQRLWSPLRLPIVRVFFTDGGAQVAIFFVLSGFVLTYKFLGQATDAGGDFSRLYSGLGSSVFRRWSRLFFPCAIVTSLYAARDTYQSGDNVFSSAWVYLDQAVSWMNPSKLLSENLMSGFQIRNAVVWTIPYEFSGSIFVYLLVLMLGRYRFSRRSAVMAVVMVMAFISTKWHLWLFAAGMALADYCRHYKVLARRVELLDRAQSSRWSTLLWTICILFALVIMSYPMPQSKIYTRPGWEWGASLPFSTEWRDVVGVERAWWGTGAVLFITGSCHLSYMRKFFETPFLQHLGKISYMLYLIHVLLSEPLGQAMQKKAYVTLCHDEEDPAFEAKVCRLNFSLHVALLVSLWLITVPAVMIASHILERFVDRPVTALGKWVDELLMRDFTRKAKAETLYDQEEQGLLESASSEDLELKDLESKELPRHADQAT